MPVLAEAATAVAVAPEPVDLSDPALFYNRELSLLEFQQRVLEEAQNHENKLLERVKFLSIVASNLDEFFMVRVAALNQKLAKGSPDRSIDGKTVTKQLQAVHSRVEDLVDSMYRCYSYMLQHLAEHGIEIVDYSVLSDKERQSVDGYYRDELFPILTPLAFDPGRPFPHISNLSLNLAIVLRSLGKDGANRQHFARVKVPEAVPQLVMVDGQRKRNGARVQKYVWIEQVIAANLPSLFPGVEIVESHPFHITRDAEVAIKELESDDLLETIEEAVWSRRFLTPVRLQTDNSIPPEILHILVENMEMNEKDVFRVSGPVDLTRLKEIAFMSGMEELKDPTFEPFVPLDFSRHAEEDIFAVIRREDQLLHHPYESFQPVVDLIQKAAHDPDVLAIKMTLYRVGRNSPIVQALLDAVENGKQVAVLLELKARFDEESNIEWARRLEAEGVHVVYGLLGLKVHCKVALVVRREQDGIRRYLHLGTGNYNASTAKLYTDISLFTCDEDLGADATDLFNFLTGYSQKMDYRKLLVAPLTLRHGVEKLIERETGFGSEGHLILKMNALEDKELIQLLYRASMAGVKVELLVRGLCCLRAGMPGISENITVTSIVGRFLEHSRIYYFRNGGEEEIYCGSADFMPRNLDRRVEVLFPVLNRKLVRRIRKNILGIYLSDNQKSRLGKPDGRYEFRKAEGEKPMDAQDYFISHRGQKS